MLLLVNVMVLVNISCKLAKLANKPNGF